MPDFLKFINELTVNGKPVEEDDEDDYTAPDEDEEAAEDQPNVDLNIGDTPEGEEQPEEEPDEDDDYTVEPDEEQPEDAEGDVDLTVDDEPAPADAEGDAETEPAADAPEDGGEVDLTPDEPGTDTEPTNQDAPDAEGDAETDTAAGGDDGLDMGDPGDDEGGDDDYTSDDDGEEDMGAEGDSDGESDVETEPDTEDNSLEAKIKQTEAEIFNTLSEDEKVIKNRELIDNYITLKNIIKTFLDRVRTITITDDNSSILQFVEVSLIDLANMITDYIITRYNKKSYIENFVTYQQIVLTVEQLKEIISKLNIDENLKK